MLEAEPVVPAEQSATGKRVRVGGKKREGGSKKLVSFFSWYAPPDGYFGLSDHPQSVCYTWRGKPNSEGYANYRVGSREHHDHVTHLYAHVLVWLFFVRFPNADVQKLKWLPGYIPEPECEQFWADIRSGVLAVPSDRLIDHRELDDQKARLCSGNHLCGRRMHLQQVPSLVNRQRGKLGGNQAVIFVPEEVREGRRQEIRESLSRYAAARAGRGFAPTLRSLRSLATLASEPPVRSPSLPSAALRSASGLGTSIVVGSSAQPSPHVEGSCSQCGGKLLDGAPCGYCLQFDPRAPPVVERWTPPDRPETLTEGRRSTIRQFERAPPSEDPDFKGNSFVEWATRKAEAERKGRRGVIGRIFGQE